jgi:hypothetical protein
MLADCHDINKNLLKVALNTITPSLTPFGMLGIIAPFDFNTTTMCN